MDFKKQYEDLAQKLKTSLPLKTYPIRELVQIFRDKGNPITLKTELTIIDVYNSGDISGIFCVIKDMDTACSLTHLTFSRTSPLYKDILDYQIKREKRIRKLNILGQN
jgi:hypothetical protein